MERDKKDFGWHEQIVIGTGLAAVGAVKGLLETGARPLVVDVGFNLPKNISDQVSIIKQSPKKTWDEKLQALASLDKNIGGLTKIPEKTLYGSTFFLGEGCHSDGFQCEDGKPPPYSYAYGGLSNGWGASFLPPARSDIESWPIEWLKISTAFGEIVSTIPSVASQDSLAEEFPVPLNSISAVTTDFEKSLLSGFEFSKKLKGSRFIAGKARLAIDQRPNSRTACVNCGLCMSGCIQGSIYKASSTFDSLIKDDRIDYIGGIRVDRICEDENLVRLHGRHEDGSEVILSCGRLFIAAGAVSTARILINSRSTNNNLSLKNNLSVKTRGGFVMPVLSLRTIEHEIGAPSLPNMFLEYRLDSNDKWVHVQLSLNNELLTERLKLLFDKLPYGKNLLKKFNKHISVALVNLHSNYSGTYEISKSNTQDISVSKYRKRKLSLLKTFQHYIFMLRNFYRAGLIPIPVMVGNYGTYHVGSTIPMSENTTCRNASDLQGRPAGYRSVHVVDSSIFPDLPATTIGLLSSSLAYQIVKDLHETR